MIAAACLLGLAPWAESIAARFDLLPGRIQSAARSADGGPPGLLSVRRSPVTNSGAATIIAAFAVVIAAFVVIVNGLASAPASGLALVIAGGAAVLVVGVRILMLVRENGVAVRMWREASNGLRELADRTGDMVLICDLDGTISYASPLASGFSYSPEALVGKGLSEFVHPEDIGAARAAVAAVVGLPEDEALTPAAADSVLGLRDRVADGEDGVDRSGRFSCRVRAADGSWRHVECAVLLYRLPGEPARLLVSLRDVSDQVALRQQVTHLTFHDGLTGLPNRAYVEERAREALEPTPDRQAGVIFLDLDGFTEVNDLVGHGAGDLVLAQAARRLREVVPAQETVARWGGDEFAVLLENAAGGQEIVELAERLAGIVAGAPFKVAEREIGLTASVGVALADESAPGVVLRNADVAMAKAKDSGGGPGGGLRAADARGRGPPPRHGERSAAGDHQGRADPAVPADRRAGHLARHRRRGPGPLVARGRGGIAAGIPHRGGGLRAYQPARRVGAAQGLRAGRRLAGRVVGRRHLGQHRRCGS